MNKSVNVYAFPHTPHFPHSAFSILLIFHTPRFPYSAFSILRIFHTPRFPHSALRVFHPTGKAPRFPHSALRTPHSAFSIQPKNFESCTDTLIADFCAINNKLYTSKSFALTYALISSDSSPSRERCIDKIARGGCGFRENLLGKCDLITNNKTQQRANKGN